MLSYVHLWRWNRLEGQSKTVACRRTVAHQLGAGVLSWRKRARERSARPMERWLSARGSSDRIPER